MKRTCLIAAAVLGTMLLGCLCGLGLAAIARQSRTAQTLPQLPPVGITVSAPSPTPPATVPPTGSSVTITLAQEQLTQVIQQAHNNQQQPTPTGEFQDRFESVTLFEPDLVRVNGTRTDLRDGSPRPISIDLRVGVVNERLDVQVVGVDIPGIRSDGSIVQIINEVLTQALAREASRNQGDLPVRRAEVRGTTLEIELGR